VRACQDFANDLELFHDGELDPPAVERLELHLGRCGACRDELEGLRALQHELTRQDASHPTPDLWSAIEARLSAVDAELKAREPRWRRFELGTWLLRPLGAVAAFGAVALVAVLARPTAPIDVVRSIDASGHPVMVLPSTDDATIIWVLDDPDDSGTGETPSGL